jgi:hypothetical protein
MWHNNILVLYTYAHVTAKTAYAILEGLGGWHLIAPTSSDGVTNVLDILTVAQANGRRVNAFIAADDTIVAVYYS